MRPSLGTYASVALLFASGCAEEPAPPATPIVESAYDHTADFSAFATFELVEPHADEPNPEGAPKSLLEVNRIAINNAILAEMNQRGLVRDSESPDLELTYYVRYQDVEVLAESGYWPDYYWGSYWGYGYPWYRAEVIEVPAGTLVIDAIAIERTPTPSPESGDDESGDDESGDDESGDPGHRPRPGDDHGDDDDDAVESKDRLVYRSTATALLPSKPTDVSAKIPSVVDEMFQRWPSED